MAGLFKKKRRKSKKTTPAPTTTTPAPTTTPKKRVKTTPAPTTTLAPKNKGQTNTDQFNITTNIETSGKIQLLYDYYPITIGRRDISVSNNLSATFNSLSGSPNVFYPKSSDAYKTNKLYIHSLIHNNIIGVTCDNNGGPLRNNIVGELIIENLHVVGSDKIYLCIFLEHNFENVINDIDNIHILNANKNQAANISVNFNNIIPKQNTCITYSDSINKVLIFTKPITINNNTYKFIKNYTNETNLFSIFPKNKNFSILPQPDILMRNNDEIYIDCNPTGVSEETISTYNVPINSEYTEDSGKLNLMRTAVQLSLISIFLIVIYFTVPTFYKAVIIDNVNKFILENNIDNNSKHKDETGGIDSFVRIQSADILLLLYSLIICVLLYSESTITHTDNYKTTIMALYFFVIIALGYASISLKKQTLSFMQTKIKPGDVEGFPYPKETDDLGAGGSSSYFPHFFIDDTWTLLMTSLNYAFGGYNKYNRIIIFAISLLWVLLLLFLRYFKGYYQISKDQFMFWLFVGIFIVIIPGVSLITLTLIKRGEQQYYTWTPTNKK